jgi:phytoene desaturase
MAIYRFDAGPSLFTLPELVEELFTLCGEQTADHFQYLQLPVNCHYFYEDGTFIQAFADREKFIQEVTHKTSESRKNLENALDNSKTLHQYLGELFMFRSLHDPATFFNPTAFRAYRNLHKMDFFRTMDQANRHNFSDQRMVQFFNRYATYNGSDPYQTPATMNIIPHLEFGKGAYFPKRGMYDITLSLKALAERNGVVFHFNTPVDQIKVEHHRVKGLQVHQENVPFDRVISNMDIAGTYFKLLKGQKPPKKLLDQPKSSSALIFYWGISRSFSQLDLHNIFFSADYKKEFDTIWKESSIDDDPTVYINITSKYKEDDAPKGHENWFTMINVPNNQGQDWDQLIDEARHRITKKLSRMLEVDLIKLIQTEAILDPRTIESKTSSTAGALYGNSSNNKFAAFLRHANFSKRFKGLYFCGGSVHPGGGIPMCLSSAKIVDRYFQ